MILLSFITLYDYFIIPVLACLFRTRLFYEIIPVKSIFGGDELHFWESESVSMPDRSRAYPIIKIVGRGIIIE